MKTKKSYETRLKAVLKKFYTMQLKTAMRSYLQIHSTLDNTDMGILIPAMIKSLNAKLKKTGTWR